MLSGEIALKNNHYYYYYKGSCKSVIEGNHGLFPIKLYVPFDLIFHLFD